MITLLGTEVHLDHSGNNGGGGKWLSSGCSVKALLIGLEGLDVACGGGRSRMGARFWLDQIQMM